MFIENEQLNYGINQEEVIETELLQETVSKQEQIQKISNSTMCHTLSAAEFLAWRISKENKLSEEIIKEYKKIFGNDFVPGKLVFGEYDSYDGGKKKPIKDLIIQFIFLIENFKGDYNNYKKNHGNKYDYPKNLEKELVLRLISLWANQIKKVEIKNGEFSPYKCSKYYENLFNLLTEKKTINYINDIFILEGDNPRRGKVNPKKLLEGQAQAYNHLEETELNDPKNSNIYLFGDNKLKYHE